MDIIYQTLEADVVLVRLNGRLDATTSPAVRDTLQKLLEKDQPRIIIDLQQVPFIDSSGLASLVSGLRLAREKNGIIALSGIQPQAQTVFHLTMLDRIFQIHPTYNDARLSLI